MLQLNLRWTRAWWYLMEANIIHLFVYYRISMSSAHLWVFNTWCVPTIRTVMSPQITDLDQAGNGFGI